MVYYIYRLAYVESFLKLWGKTNLIMWMTYFTNACNKPEDIFMRIFTSTSIRDIGFQVLLLCFYLVFGIEIIPNMGFMEEVLK